MRRIFISHKYSDNPNKNKKRTNKICRNLIERTDDILPISPLHLFSFLEEEGNYRIPIMRTCFDMIITCDEVWIYVDEKISEGQQHELDFALDLGIEVKFIREPD